MSHTPVEIVEVKSILSHPNADRLEIVGVLDTQFIAPRCDFQLGDKVVYFPPDILIPEPVAEALGVRNYLKHAIYPDDPKKTQCRVGAIRLRGQPSFGFGLPLRGRLAKSLSGELGADVSDAFDAVKYQPPVKLRSSDAEPDHPLFHKYTDIQHYYRYAEALPEGTPVRITEKIHGTNSRVGSIASDGLMGGSHNIRVKYQNANGDISPYWRPMTQNMVEMLDFIGLGGRHSVIVFGEIYGAKVQSMDYGLPLTGYRVFDISVDSQYLDWVEVKDFCDLFDIPTVLLLYEGPFKRELVDQYISGPTKLAAPENIRCDFKGREGIVITPLEETYSNVLGGRLILKAVSPDYLEKT
jgi:RNA ligase (TIGR02306 family)